MTDDNMPNHIMWMPRYEQAQGHLDPLRSITNTVVFGVDDWGDSRAKAWIYGIVCGWDDEDGSDDTYRELGDKFGWSADDIERLKQLHARWVELERDDAPR